MKEKNIRFILRLSDVERVVEEAKNNRTKTKREDDVMDNMLAVTVAGKNLVISTPRLSDCKKDYQQYFILNEN